ncbi:cupin domain-containing protein [Endozoicomonas atrinae]|uniref:cupin domain-containing protein n=1 Tax=Endozoicomonas atrinae TaxID=1333660 RepID=UPI0008252CB3|nr:cupin domain-containing protein [Endozoicomonas atrinae]
MSKALKHLIPDNFLNEYWQKKPLLIRQAIPDFVSPLSADELAGLSLEEEVESRLILEKGETPWELRHGPFTEETFSSLPESHWTLLVQAVDHWVPEVHELLEYFRFLPSWRLEDIMISYASDGGNVGPHYDQFDVFLIQAEGKRRWQIGPLYNDQTPMVENTSLHILSEFNVLEDYVLEPGDMLYLPPGVGHHGVAEGECMTISVGFRAPSHRDILMQFTDFVSDQLSESLRYSDAGQQPVSNPGRIDEQAIDRIQAVLRQYTEDRNLIVQWFGSAMTQTKHPQDSEDTIEQWSELISEFSACNLRVNEGSRIAFYEGSSSVVFVDGEYQQCNNKQLLIYAEKLGRTQYLPSENWTSCVDPESQKWLLALVNQGSLYPEEAS